MGLNYLFSSAARITSQKQDAWNTTFIASRGLYADPFALLSGRALPEDEVAKAIVDDVTVEVQSAWKGSVQGETRRPDLRLHLQDRLPAEYPGALCSFIATQAEEMTKLKNSKPLPN